MRPRILTVDDSKTIRLIVAKAFKPYDCGIFEASNGVEGLAAATKERPNLIILDLTMPVMDGAEMLGRLKANPELKGIPVIMLTAEAGRETVLRIARLGVRDYQIKPFKEELLIERVGRVVDLRLRGGETVVRRFDDALRILVLDDKPAIAEQIRNGLADTPWRIEARSTPGQAMDFCNTAPPDIILVSLSLPDAGGFSFFQSLRVNARLKNVPVFGLSVKTAIEEQARAQQVGFAGIATKPIDVEDLKVKIARALNLDSSYKYFENLEGVLVIRIPGVFNPVIANEVSSHLRSKLADAVDSGVDKIIIDLSQVKKADVSVIRLGLEASQLCTELSLKLRMIGSDAVSLECRNYQETKDWQFENNFEEALAALSSGALVSAAA